MNTDNVSPAKSTTNIPPTFSTPSEFAFEFLSSLLHFPVLFHHLLYNICIFPSSWRLRTAIDNLSLSGESEM